MKGKRILALLLSVILLIAAAIPAAAYGQPKKFSDVPDNAWYKESLDKLSSFGIIAGDPGGTYRPEENLSRGEFLSMLYNAANTATMQYVDENGKAGSYEEFKSIHWAQPYWNVLNDMGILNDSGIKCTWNSLEGKITRNEMATLVTNMLYKDYYEDKVSLKEPTKLIQDYSSIPSGTRYYVEQAYGKGILSGYSDHCFHGGNTLTRAEAASVVCRLLFAQSRVKVAEATTVKPTTTPAAIQWQKNGWINAYGKASAELRQILFGDSNKSYFTSQKEAGDHIVAVNIPVWKIDKNGKKYSSKDVVYVNAAVADDVKAIFQQIYDDPERFPIISTSSFRNTDTMRHSWGCAIDINAAYNPECRANYNNNTVSFSVGSGWWPLGTDKTIFSGSLTGASPYSIPAGGSVVKAFSDYGWGWGGQGYSVRKDNTQKFDYMHFSIMASGG